jgi:hypothetical protein
MMAADMSLRLGWIEAGLVDRIRALNEKAKLPTAPPPVGGWPLFLSEGARTGRRSPARCQGPRVIAAPDDETATALC